MVCARNKTGKRSGINMVAGSVGWMRAIDLTWIRWPKALLSGASSLTVSQARAVGQTSNIKQRQHSPFLCPTTRQPHGQADYERCWRHGRIAFKFPSGQHCEQVTRDECRLPRCDGSHPGLVTDGDKQCRQQHSRAAMLLRKHRLRLPGSQWKTSRRPRA
jgi:hypothetical protein